MAAQSNAEQLALSSCAPAESAPVAYTWTKGPVDRTGLAAYIHLIRAPDDPERTPRAKSQRRSAKGEGAAPSTAWLRELKSRSVSEWQEAIRALLAEGEESGIGMTFNGITVRLAGLTADMAAGAAPDEALWALVDAGVVEHTLEAPVRFRLVTEGGPRFSAPASRPPIPG